mgnify:CR=1 FL=1
MYKLLRYGRRYLLSVALDVLVVAASLSLAWTGRSITASLDVRSALLYGLLAAVVYCSANYLLRLYHCLWGYAAAGEVVTIAYASFISTAVLAYTNLSWPGGRLVPISVVLLTGLFASAGFVSVRYRRRVLTGLRWRWRVLRGELPAARTRLLIVGAGEAGQLLAQRFLNEHESQGYELVGFVDDSPAKRGMEIHGIPILGDRGAIPSLVERYGVDLIAIAIHNISPRAFRDILSICERTSARVRVLPDLLDFVQGTKGLPPIRDVTVEDLLGRKQVEIDHEACRLLLEGKTVLVTGAAGSIGSELCRQILHYSPGTLLAVDNNESGLFDLTLELESRWGPERVLGIVGDVTNRPKMQSLFARHRPQVVFHAAAYKHVPLMEEQPDEAVRVNVLGTRIVADLACQGGAERFVLISTDKAVSPTSIMGATKRIGEMLVGSLATARGTRCTAVRFGNVLGSRGSVVPIFEKQIASGGPVTITHPEMTRFFMSIPEAVSLVIQAATVTEGGDLFVLDMGEQVRIADLALRLIRLHGLRPGIDIPIKYTGIRPGEKLREELTGDADEKCPTWHPAIFRIRPRCRLSRKALHRQIGELVRLAARQKNGELTARLWDIVGRMPGAQEGRAPSPSVLSTPRQSGTATDPPS